MQRTLSLEVLVGPAERHRALSRDVRRGLSGEQKEIPPTWFYDERGSRLFEEITRLPEYYPTRTERAILESRAKEIALLTKADTLVEIGSGTSEKTKLLLDAMAADSGLREVILLDISRDVLLEAAEALGRSYGVDIYAVVGDFWRDLGAVPQSGRQLWVFLGGTLGNLRPPARQWLLEHIRRQMGEDGHLLLGTDLVKEPARLVAAYDDASGVTAEFNRNVLRVINGELGADFDAEAFEHRAVWNEEQSWIEMRLRAKKPQSASVSDLGLAVEFAKGEEILTEISAKFTPEMLERELTAAGLGIEAAWQDDNHDFQVTLLRAAR